MQQGLELAVIGAAAIGIIALLVMRAATGRVARMIVLVVLSPLVLALGVMILSVFSASAEKDAIGNAFFAVMLFGTILLFPWLGVCAIGSVTGLLLRRRFPPPAPVAALAAVSSPPASPIYAAPPQRFAPAGEPERFAQTSPDGAIRIDIQPVEWAASMFVNTPRAVEAASGRILCDLIDTDWEANSAFPGDGQLWLGLRRYSAPGFLFADFDLAADRYRIALHSLDTPEEEGPIGDISARLEAWWPHANALAMDRAAPAQRMMPKSAGPGRFAAWRTALAILAAAMVAIAGLTYFSLRTGIKPPHVPFNIRPGAAVPHQ